MPEIPIHKPPVHRFLPSESDDGTDEIGSFLDPKYQHIESLLNDITDSNIATPNTVDPRRIETQFTCAGSIPKSAYDHKSNGQEKTRI
ncbi:unnamed protein product [Rotaria socialis]|uniref:Uncharacterized protein n=2 Tax=Rotaria socialis TaxID=392032 RepID=A0A817TUD6_9BILA|nr:unnamed protein product [Rotaria socialis]